MSELDVGGLRALAQQVTQGRWKSWGMQVLASQDGTSNVDTAVPVASTHYCDENLRPRTFDADWIIATQPEEILPLIARLEAAEAAVARVEALADHPDWPIEVALGGYHYVGQQLRAALAGVGDVGGGA